MAGVPPRRDLFACHDRDSACLGRYRSGACPGHAVDTPDQCAAAAVPPVKSRSTDPTPRAATSRRPSRNRGGTSTSRSRNAALLRHPLAGDEVGWNGGGPSLARLRPGLRRAIPARQALGFKRRQPKVPKAEAKSGGGKSPPTAGPKTIVPRMLPCEGRDEDET